MFYLESALLTYPVGNGPFSPVPRSFRTGLFLSVPGELTLFTIPAIFARA